jgi:hypothetical protein
VQGGRGTGYCGREGVFVMLASSKRGLVSLISCSEINSFLLVVCLYVTCRSFLSVLMRVLE